MSGLKQAARAGLRRGVALVPLGLLRRWMPRELTALFYHAVSDEEMPHVEHLYPPLSVAQFEASLVYLKRHFNPVGYDDVHRWFSDGVDLPERAVHLSFDDGFGECCRVVMPLLQKHGVSCTFFVTTDWIDNRAMFYRNKVSLCIGALRNLDRDALAMVLTSLSNALERPVRTA
ncbi:MAG: polysaccharide deacetylase family protein, partial [Anaerolineae bacterium]|nr:polysaccharide deacetylase family protein [Anaerolineae bacterium]